LGKDNGGAIFKYNPTLEHVLPNKFEENWINDLLSWNNSLTKEQIIEKVKLSINKFGNYCLLTQSWNAKNSNLSFELKKNKLKSLVSPLWRNTLNPKIDIANKEKWNFEEIEARNSELIRIIIEEIYDN
jgi:hypothetical protein